MDKDKQYLRNTLSRKLALLTEDSVARCSREAVDRLVTAIDWQAVDTVHVYRSQLKWREVDTSALIAWIEAAHPHIQISTTSSDRYAAFPGKLFQLIIVPLVGFDDKLHRLGRGAGWYDSFLAMQPDAHKVGLGLEANKVDSVPMESHDVPLDLIVTEDAVYGQKIRYNTTS